MDEVEVLGLGPAATLAFAARTGLLKGKFSLYYDYWLNGAPQHKAVSVPYAGALTPGIPEYVRHPGDRALLLERHAA